MEKKKQRRPDLIQKVKLLESQLTEANDRIKELKGCLGHLLGMYKINKSDEKMIRNLLQGGENGMD